MRLLRSPRKGFTLIELLIVVAIIGVLSTIGVPTFRRMVQKAKKSEAKVALGGLFTAESSFFSEYGGYGNNLAHVGFELEGNNRIYSVGFGVDGQKACANAVIKPKSTSSAGTGLNQVLPVYYSGPLATFLPSAGTAVCYSKTSNNTIPDDGSHFYASALGSIAPGVVPTGTAIGDAPDIWMINNRRTLTNCLDGVNGAAEKAPGSCAAFDENS